MWFIICIIIFLGTKLLQLTMVVDKQPDDPIILHVSHPRYTTDEMLVIYCSLSGYYRWLTFSRDLY